VHSQRKVCKHISKGVREGLDWAGKAKLQGGVFASANGKCHHDELVSLPAIMHLM